MVLEGARPSFVFWVLAATALFLVLFLALPMGKPGFLLYLEEVLSVCVSPSFDLPELALTPALI